MRRIRQPRADREQVALNALEHRDQLAIVERGTREAEPRIQLVDVAVGGHARIRLGAPRAVEQPGLAAVARPGVDFHWLIIKNKTEGRGSRSEVRGPGSGARGAGRGVRGAGSGVRAPGQGPSFEARGVKREARSLSPATRQKFRRRLLQWYRRNGRDLPWRRTTDPYHILVSEVMLQQTQVDRVLPKYEEWLGKDSTFAGLAAAPEEEVPETRRPLGYNIRPRRLHAIARESVERYGGSLPSDESTLRSFKGIGEYTAGAVLSFAFGQRAAIP